MYSQKTAGDWRVLTDTNRKSYRHGRWLPRQREAVEGVDLQGARLMVAGRGQ